MSTQGALVIDLTEYRRRREASSKLPAAAAAPVVWYPVLVWVPLWPFA